MDLFDSEIVDLTLDGAELDRTPYQRETVRDGANVLIKRRFAGGLEVNTEGRLIAAFGAYEWRNTLVNRGAVCSGKISQLWDCACLLALPHDENRRRTAYRPREAECAMICAPSGSTWSEREFFDEPEATVGDHAAGMLFPGWKKRYTASGGRSSEARAPFFNIYKQGQGYIVAVGWSGQWCFECERTNDGVIIKSGIEGVDFCLEANEELRTSSVVILPYKGTAIDGQNQWRRLVREHFSLIGPNGRAEYAPLCAGLWGGMTTNAALDRLRVIDEARLPFEYVWMDAGWYGAGAGPSPDEFEGDWPVYTGDWRVNEDCHPQGLGPIAWRAHESGRRFLLWFEPERAHKGVPITKRHPEYFIEKPGSDELLLNLGNEEAYAWCLGLLCERIEALHIDCLRWDFNLSPLEYWNLKDAPERRGVTQIRHISALYRLWDTLLDRYDWLLIDNCASGGRRIDIETLRRSVPLWRSDAMCPADFRAVTAQCHAQTFPLWLPYSGTSTGRLYDTYHARSCYSPALTTNYTFSERDSFGDDPAKLKWLRETLREFLALRSYFDGDFYPLTSFSACDDQWTVLQYDRPESGDGAVLAFRRDGACFAAGEFALRGCAAGRSLLVSEKESGGEWTAEGARFRIELPQKRSSRLMYYKIV